MAEELMKIGVELEQAQKWRRKLVGVMLYPCMVILLTVVLCVLLWVWWLPKLDAMLESTSGRSSPSVVGGGHAVEGSWLVWAGCFMFVVSLVVWVRRRWSGRQLAQPSLLQQCRTARMLAGLLHAGLALPAALSETSGLVRRPHAKRNWAEGIARIEAGELFSKVAIERNWWGPDYEGVLCTGEQTGRTAEVLEDIAAWLEEEIERKCQRVLVLTEPALLIVIAGIVLWMVSRFIEPMLRMLEASGL